MARIQFDHVADLLRGLRERGDLVVGVARFGRRSANDAGGEIELASNLRDRAGQFVRRRCGGLDVARGYRALSAHLAVRPELSSSTPAVERIVIAPSATVSQQFLDAVAKWRG
jgi:hypothetical protein